MSDDVERLNRVLDDLAAERDPADRAALSSEERDLARMAAMLKAAAPGRLEPHPQFVERLGARLGALPGMQARRAAAEPGAASPPAVATPALPEETKRDDDTHAPAARPRGVSRRRLFGRVAAVAAGAAAGAGAADALRGHADTAAASAAYERGKWDGSLQAESAPLTAPMVPRDRGRWFTTGYNAAAIAPWHAVRFRAGAVEGFLVNPGGDKPIYALSAACTHMGCMLSWLEGAGTFLCPCHGAQYQADGKVLSGIARHPLPRLQVRVDAEGDIYVWSVAEQPPTTSVVPYKAP